MYGDKDLRIINY